MIKKIILGLIISLLIATTVQASECYKCHQDLKVDKKIKFIDLYKHRGDRGGLYGENRNVDVYQFEVRGRIIIVVTTIDGIQMIQLR